MQDRSDGLPEPPFFPKEAAERIGGKESGERVFLSLPSDSRFALFYTVPPRPECVSFQTVT